MLTHHNLQVGVLKGVTPLLGTLVSNIWGHGDPLRIFLCWHGQEACKFIQFSKEAIALFTPHITINAGRNKDISRMKTIFAQSIFRTIDRAT